MHSEGSSQQMRPMHSMVGAQYIHAPVFLRPTDVLSFAFTLCSNMVDCNSQSTENKHR
jgi:hypothetical protein